MEWIELIFKQKRERNYSFFLGRRGYGVVAGTESGRFR